MTENLSKQDIVSILDGGVCGGFLSLFLLVCTCCWFCGVFLEKKAEPTGDVSNEGTGLSLLYP